MPSPSPTQILRDMALEADIKKYPNMKPSWHPKLKVNQSTANGVTAAIIKFLQLKGQQAERISVTGRRVDQRKTYTDVLGHQRQIGQLKWIKPSMQVGTADISATINGRSVKIEVKVGRDKQRPAQKEYQAQVERAGGIYYIAVSFDEFYHWYMEMFEGEKRK